MDIYKVIITRTEDSWGTDTREYHTLAADANDAIDRSFRVYTPLEDDAGRINIERTATALRGSERTAIVAELRAKFAKIPGRRGEALRAKFAQAFG